MFRLGLAVLIVIGAAFSTRADPNDLLSAGSEAIHKGQWDEAIRVLSQAIAQGALAKPDLATAHTNRGYAYFGEGQVDKAITDYTAAIKLAPNDADPHSLRGWAHFTEGKFREAIADSTAAIRLDPNLAFALRNRGRAELYTGRPRPAADDFAAAVRLAPSDLLGVIWLHVARVRSGQADQQEFAANVVKIDRRTWPGPIADILTGAVTQDKLGDIAKSAQGEKSQGERVCDAQVYLGLLQLAAGDKREAEMLLRAAVVDCPTGAAEATEIAVAKLELKGMGARGPAGAGLAMRAPVGDPGANHRDRAFDYFGRGEVDQAIAEYNAAIRLAKDDADSYGLRGLAHFVKGNMNQAIADSGAAIRLKPDSAFDFRNRGRAQLYAGKPRLAADDFASAVRLAPSDTLGVLWLHIARVRSGQNDQQEFRQNIDRVDRRTWPGPLVEVLTGDLTPERVGDIAMSAEGDKRQLERRCDAQVYLGLLQLAAGDKEEARSFFRAAEADCPVGVAEATERTVAKMELKQLGPGRASTGLKPAERQPATAQPRPPKPGGAR
jgi:lipoprotein NlpI